MIRSKIKGLPSFLRHAACILFGIVSAPASLCEPPASALPVQGSKEYRGMLGAITPTETEAGFGVKMDPMNGPENLSWVVWRFHKLPNGEKPGAYNVEVSISRPDPKMSLENIKATLLEQLERGMKNEENAKEQAVKELNFTTYPQVGDWCYSYWIESRRYVMRRGPFTVNMLGKHGDAAFIILRAYDKKIQAYMKK